MSVVADILESKSFRIILIVVIGFVVLRYVGSRIPTWFKGLKQTSAQNQAGSQNNQITVTDGSGQTADINALANQYYSAMYYWLGTDEDVLFALAAKTRPPIFKQVSDRYRSLFDADLLADIEDDLSPSEFQRFLQIAGL